MIEIKIVIEETPEKLKIDVTGFGQGTLAEIELAQLITIAAEECHKLMALHGGTESKLTHRKEVILPMDGNSSN